MTETTAAERWAYLDGKRRGVLDRARACAALTLPHLLPPDGHTEDSDLPTPYQGLGARGVNNISSKLLLALAPPNASFFRYSISDAELQEYLKQNGEKSDVEADLAIREQQVMSDLEASNFRVVLSEFLRLLIATGNACLFQGPDGSFKTWGLNHYVVARDAAGNLLELVIKEAVAKETLSAEIRETCQIDSDEKLKNEKNVDVYTWVRREVNSWVVHQEINKTKVPDSDGSYRLDEPAYLVPRLSAIAGEDYGRGLVQEYIGDLRSLEGLTKAVVIAAAVSAKVLFLRNPNAVTKVKELTDSVSGDVINGKAEDISVLQVEKYPDFKVALEVMNTISQRLAQAFLLNTAVQRQAERVTAEEIRYVAQELEDALGGIYSRLAHELQLPLIKRRIGLLERRNKIAPLPKDLVKPIITTGLEALGRGHDIARIRAFLEDLQILGDQLFQRLNIETLIKRVATARSVDTSDLIYTDEQMKTQQRNNMLAQLTQGAGPGVIQELVKSLVTQGTK